MREATRKRLLWVLAIVVTLPVAAIGAAVAYVMIEQGRIDRRADYAHRITFDPPGWRSSSETADDVRWPTRLRMIDDLVARKLLDGLRREEVGSLLGPRDQTDKWSGWELVYWLGPERYGIPIDSEWLVIRFDKTGRVSEYRVVTD